MTTNDCTHPKGVIGLKQWRCLACGETRELPRLDFAGSFEPVGLRHAKPQRNARLDRLSAE